MGARHLVRRGILLAGALLKLLRVRHVAFYGAAGALIALAVSRIAPLIVGDFGAGVFGSELSGLDLPLVIVAVLLAGAANGMIFWLVARHVMPRAP